MASDGPRDALGERPDGPVSGLLYDQMLRHNVAFNHCAAEGKPLVGRAVVTGYDRNEHPWLHGRRAHDIIERVREVFSRE